MSVSLSKSGFTLIEVLAAVGAFTIAFLAGFATIGTFMIRQDMNYQRTQAAAAAQFLTEWHTNKVITAAAGSRPDFIGSASGAAASYPLQMPWSKASNEVKTYVTYKGGDMAKGTDELFIFSDDCTLGAKTLKNHGFGMRHLIVTVSPPISEAQSGTETFGAITFRQISFWYGSKSDILALSASAKTTIEFLGRYMIAEPIP